MHGSDSLGWQLGSQVGVQRFDSIVVPLLNCAAKNASQSISIQRQSFGDAFDVINGYYCARQNREHLQVLALLIFIVIEQRIRASIIDRAIDYALLAAA